jgi:AP-4 complex subunit epsilon-1
MTNAVNVEFIVDKLLSFLANATDDHFRTDLVGQITQCAERFAPSNAWYVQTVIKVFELALDKVKSSVAHTLTQLIAEGSDSESAEDSALTGSASADCIHRVVIVFTRTHSPTYIHIYSILADDELRAEAVENFLLLIGRPTLPETLAQAIAWILGEYGYLSTSSSKEEIMMKLVNLFTQSSHDSTKSQVPLLPMYVVWWLPLPTKLHTVNNLFAGDNSVDETSGSKRVLPH